MSATDYSKFGRAELIRALKQRDAERRLGLVWERDDIEREQALNDDFVGLDLVTKYCEGTAPYYNALIEGDNLDALRNLAVPLAGSVKCIYIDPPYNTGGDDFIYNDRYMKAEDRYRHSTWLEFIYRRLAVAKTLLAPDGAIFVSIGEDEQARLSLMMEEVFGPSAKVGTFVWRRRSGANDEKKWFVSVDHEYVHCFANPGFSFTGTEKDFSRYTNPDKDKRGRWVEGDLSKQADFKIRPNTFYPIQNSDTEIWYPCSPNRVWAFASEKRAAQTKTRRESMEQLIRENRIIWPEEQNPAVYRNVAALKKAIASGDAPLNLEIYQGTDKIDPPLKFWVGKKIGRGTPKYKRFLNEVKRREKPVSTWLLPSSIKASELELVDLNEVDALSCGYTQEGTKLVSAMLNNREFSFPKPLSLVKALVKSATSPVSNDIVLDFFAGSGTTGHAVMELNELDRGNRRFILVSSTEATKNAPRKNVCRDIARRRLSAAINGYKYSTKKGKKSVNSLGGDFAYFRTARIIRGRARREIRHDQIWIALMMIHFPIVTPWKKDAPWAFHESESERIAYLAKTDTATMRKAQQWAQGEKPCVIYARQPGVVAETLAGSKAEVRKIPDYILRRHGLESE